MQFMYGSVIVNNKNSQTEKKNLSLLWTPAWTLIFLNTNDKRRRNSPQEQQRNNFLLKAENPHVDLLHVVLVVMKMHSHNEHCAICNEPHFHFWHLCLRLVLHCQYLRFPLLQRLPPAWLNKAPCSDVHCVRGTSEWKDVCHLLWSTEIHIKRGENWLLCPYCCEPLDKLFKPQQSLCVCVRRAKQNLNLE